MPSKKVQAEDSTAMTVDVENVTDEPETNDLDQWDSVTEEKKEDEAYEKFLDATDDKPKGERQSIFFRELLNSVQTPDYLDLKGVVEIATAIPGNEETNTIAKVTLDTINKKEAQVYKDLFTALDLNARDGLPARTPNNIGLVSYDHMGKFKWFSYPMIGLKDGQLGLMIGADNKSENMFSAFVPIERKQSLDDPNKTLYTLNGVTLDCIVIKEVIEVAFIRFKTDGYVFHLNLKVDRDTKATAIESAFDSGNLSKVVLPFMGEAANLSKMFKLLFDNNKFPAEGVLLRLENGAISRGEYQGKELISSRWKLTGVPPQYQHLMVETITDETDASGQKSKKLVTLAEVKTLFLSGSAQPTKLVIDAEPDNVSHIYLYIIGPHKSGNINWIPSHVATKNSNRLPPPALKQAVSSNLLLKGSNAQPAIPVSKEDLPKDF